MVSFIIALLSISLFISCSPFSNEGKAKKMIEERVKNRLVAPSSYKLVSFKLDSCFSDDKERGEMLSVECEIGKLYSQYKEYKGKAQSAEYSMKIYNSEYSKPQYRIYKEEYDKQTGMLRAAKMDIQNLYNSYKIMYPSWGKHEFIGFKARVEYQAKRIGGDVATFPALFFFDKYLSYVTHVFYAEDLFDLEISLNLFESDLKKIFDDHSDEELWQLHEQNKVNLHQTQVPEGHKSL